MTTVKEAKAEVDRIGIKLDAARAKVNERLRDLRAAEEDASRWCTVYEIARSEREAAFRAECSTGFDRRRRDTTSDS